MNLSNYCLQLFTTVILSCSINLLFAQLPVGTLSGKVIDQDNDHDLVGATLLLKKDTAIISGAISNEKGRFYFEDIPTGRYLLSISYIGYTRKEFVVLIESGKSSYLSIGLKESATTLSMLELTAGRAGVTPLSNLGSYVLTVEETRRFPANFDDPVRLIHALPGVANNNDQNNTLVVRGNSPNGLSWRLEDAEIVSPNHLSNAGTFSDRASRNAGGVNILSGQLLSTSNFLAGPFPSPFGNTTSGVLDMHLRNGNAIKHQYTAQASLLGFDLAAEGPITKDLDHPSTFLVNYRYSFTGLLADLGVDFGGEEIRFQDLAFHLHFPLQKNNQISVFGLGGISSNDFLSERDTAAWTEFKDQQDIKYENKMGAVGLSYTHAFPSAVLKHSLVISALKTERASNLLNSNFNVINEDEDLIQQSKHVLHSVFSKKINPKHRFQIGMQLKRGTDEVFSNYNVTAGNPAYFDGSSEHWLFQPYANWSWSPTSLWQVKAGIRYNYEGNQGHQSTDPSVEFNFHPGDSHLWTFAYSHNSQQALPELLYTQSLTQPEPKVNRNLGFNKSHYLSLGHHWSFINRSANLTSTAFYQHHYDVPVDISGGTTFSAINLLEAFQNNYRLLRNDGTGDNYGLELSYDQLLLQDFFFLLNATLYQATYTDALGEKRDSRFNGNFILNLTGGREWSWIKKGRAKTLGINTRFSLRGGYREMPIDLIASRAAGYTIFDEGTGFSEQQTAYHRLDLRVYLKNNHQRFTSLFSFDIQNVLNRQNQAYAYYDPFLDKIVEEKQLGLIPNLSYRIVF